MAYINDTHAEGLGEGRWRSEFSAKFRRFMDRLQEARLREARRQIAPYLNSLDDQTLTSLGFTRDEVKPRF